MSFEVTPGIVDPLKTTFMFFNFEIFNVCVANTCSTSDVPIPIARQPNAP